MVPMTIKKKSTLGHYQMINWDVVPLCVSHPVPDLSLALLTMHSVHECMYFDHRLGAEQCICIQLPLLPQLNRDQDYLAHCLGYVIPIGLGRSGRHAVPLGKDNNLGPVRVAKPVVDAVLSSLLLYIHTWDVLPVNRHSHRRHKVGVASLD